MDDVISNSSPETPKKKKFSIVGLLIKIFVGLVAICVIGVAGLYYYYNQSLTTSNSGNIEKSAFTIKQGESVDQIIENLINAGLLKSDYKYFFKFYLSRENLGGKLQAGEFSIPKNLTMIELGETLQKAGQAETWVVIPEGLRKDEIATILDNEMAKFEKKGFDKAEFLKLTEDQQYVKTLGLTVMRYKPQENTTIDTAKNNMELANLEGFLFPDKYRIPVNYSAKQIIELMVVNLKSKVGDKFYYDDIIIASMLEREGKNDQDRPMIADIIRRRQDEGWLLQVDATLLYYYKDWKHTLSKEDLKLDHPYNTYVNAGLPPTPICNPSISSIKATQNPSKNEYYFYIHDTAGKAYFAKTLEGHNLNISKYLNK